MPVRLPCSDLRWYLGLRSIFYSNACDSIRWKPDDKLLSSVHLDQIFFAKTLSMVR